jgi:DNA polymerase-1
MIYLVTKQPLSLPDITLCTVQESLDYFKDLEWVAIDTETSGFDPYTCKLYTLQLGDNDNQFVVDLTTIDINDYKPLLESKGVIGHNLKFDLKFLYHQRIVPTKVYDTFLGEKTSRLGIESHRCSLAACVKLHCGVVLDKEERKNITGNLTEGFVKYSAYDVKYLHAVKEAQEVILFAAGSKVSIDLDNRFVLVLAYIEYCGMKLDVDKWTNKIHKVQTQADKATRRLNDFIFLNEMDQFIDYQLDLFSSEKRVNINWNSPAQVVQFFKAIGVDTAVVEKGVKKDTIEANHLIKFADKHPIIKTYLSFKEAQKDTGTYGYNWIEQINPVSGRIHTQFKQLMNTGRLSSGGKSGTTKNFNFQNIPSDEETRSCFVAEEGNTLVGCDYTGQEQIVLVNKCLDDNLLEFYDKDLGDMHSFVASKMYEELDGLDLNEIKKKHKEKRQSAKVAGFAINYGGSGIGIADQLGLDVEQGNKIYEAYFFAFPGLKAYFDEAKKFGVENGYVLISPVTGKRSYVDYYTEFTQLKNEMDKSFWDKYKQLKNATTPTALDMKEKVSKFFRKRGDIERMSLNYPIQGESAEITKLACVYFWLRYLVPNDLLFKVKIINVIHDEILVETPETIAQQVAAQLEKSMVDSGAKFCTRILLKADPCISPYWSK